MEARELIKIAIVTDSTCDLSEELVDKFNIHILPLKVVYGKEEYQDGIEIRPEEVYARFPDEIPSTSMPGPGEVKDLFQRLEDEGYTHVISIHISSGLSGTAEMVRMMAQEFPHLQVEVIDSKGLSLALGFLVLRAAQLRDLGTKFQELIDQLYQARSRIKVFFILKTLEYLKKGGRIGFVQASLGEVLDVKPIISINEDGKYFTLAKVRGRMKSIGKLKEMVLERAREKAVNLAVMHGDAEEEARSLYQDLLGDKAMKIKEHFFGQIGPVMVTHTGPGLIGVAYEELG